MPGPRLPGPRGQDPSWYKLWGLCQPICHPPPPRHTQMSRLGGAVPDYHIIAPEPASWALGRLGLLRSLGQRQGREGRDPDCPSFSAQEADMPDEVNIDELLELESEEERSRKIQVGGRESRT